METTQRYDVVVAGGGVAGLTAAAYCAKAGLRTLVCERADKPGGLVGTFTRAGFSFDAGIRAFEDSSVITPMLRSLGSSLEFVKNPVTIGIGSRSVRLLDRSSLHDYANLFKSFFPDQAAAIDGIAVQIETVMRYMDVLYGAENPLFLDRELRDPKYLAGTLLPWLLDYSVNMRKAARLDAPVRQYLRRFTQSEPLIDMICQHFFADTPTFFALSYFGLYLDYRYPVGGTGQLPLRLAEIFSAQGGTLLTGADIVGVSPATRTAALADGRTFRYGQLIWAADQTALYRALGEPLPKAARRQKALVERSRGIDSILTLYLGTGISPAEAEAACGAHAFYTPVADGFSSLPDWRTLRCDGTEALRRWTVSYLETTTYELSIPALRDPALAPAGKTGWIASTLFDYELAKFFADSGEYESFKSLATKTILRVLGASLLPGLTEKIEYSFCATPLTIERETGARHGAITGWAYTNRPIPAVHDFKKLRQAIRTGLPDVLQCGMWTFSPAGLPVSIITGKLAADEAARRLKRRGARA
ncbi:MAG: NAD(P)/FAD-dependent oxidoreductase [Clostridiales bacterium]|nr:NAD(P)/FAD-dependent oxidoreductase [Clostridiales bacterium]